MSEELTPMNHRELWLKAIATGTVPEWLEPMTHEELWLKAIAQGGGGGSVEPIVIDLTDSSRYWESKSSGSFKWYSEGYSLSEVASIVNAIQSGSPVVVKSRYDDGYMFSSALAVSDQFTMGDDVGVYVVLSNGSVGVIGFRNY
jgi:hypothetical protein